MLLIFGTHGGHLFAPQVLVLLLFLPFSQMVYCDMHERHEGPAVAEREGMETSQGNRMRRVNNNKLTRMQVLEDEEEVNFSE